MNLFRRTPELVKVWVPSLTDCGHTIIAVPAHVAEHINALNEENDALVESARVMADKQQQRLAKHLEVKAGLYRQLREAGAAVRGLIQERDRALAEVKNLHATLAQVDCENLRLGGELATAQEQIAGYRLEVAT